MTLACHTQLALVRRWDWTSVLGKVVWWAVAFVVLIVGVGKVVTLVLSALNVYLAPFSLGATTLIFVGIGLVMFLLPPVPGVPVYLAGGVILTNAAKASCGFWGGAAFTVAVCCGIKFCAIALAPAYGLSDPLEPWLLWCC